MQVKTLIYLLQWQSREPCAFASFRSSRAWRKILFTSTNKAMTAPATQRWVRTIYRKVEITWGAKKNHRQMPADVFLHISGHQVQIISINSTTWNINCFPLHKITQNVCLQLGSILFILFILLYTCTNPGYFITIFEWRSNKQRYLHKLYTQDYNLHFTHILFH